MDLCTVTNKRFIKSAINLVNSYKINSYNKNVFLYYFDCEESDILWLKNNIDKKVNLISIPKICDFAFEPTVFFYKSFSINNCVNSTKDFIYSDATNVFNRFEDIYKFLIDDSIFLQYNNQNLLNKYWTTKKCFKKMECQSAENMMQYWGGLQVYISTNENKNFIKKIYNYMLDSDIAMPGAGIKYPDGKNNYCIEHRQDQSVFSLMIHKELRHQNFDPIKQSLFGDWQTFKDFDKSYIYNLENCVISSRESKFGFYRFL